MAQFRVGCFYQEGKGTPSNLKKAVEFYRKAAKQGHPLAQYRLAECYQRGDGVPQNLGEAINWYRRSASQQYLPALQKLSECYEGDSQNPTLSVFWHNAYEKALQATEKVLPF